MELVDFLRARLDEDERVAREAAQHAGAALATAAAHEGVWKPPYDGPEWWNDYDHIFVVCDRPGQPRKVMIADCDSGAFTLTPHIARHDPTRVLAEVESKRRIVENLAAVQLEQTRLRELRGPLAEVTLRMLARPFRAHSDFDPSWLED
ncbi:DUF6221 family protein [Streptomyces mirabilis]|uniref:DUF6221 family protein n=1 Tax=Streptomyces mirabilis TaxID=68239 RepID=UPI00332212F2